MSVVSNFQLYGTDEPVPQVTKLSTGTIFADFLNGGLANIRFGATEMIRSINYLVRDEDWGTIVPQVLALSVLNDANGFSICYTAQFVSKGATLKVLMSIQADNQQLAFTAKAIPDKSFLTNRAGFTVLHPIEASGKNVCVEHSNGDIEQTRLPMVINPWQPFKDIRCLSHDMDGVTASCRLEGDVFEMEDQRNWSDASFKTYSRPLAWKWPYILEEGQLVEQSVIVSFSGECRTSKLVADEIKVSFGEATAQVFPKIALEVTAMEARGALNHLALLRDVAPQKITCHIDPQSGNLVESAREFAQLQKMFDAEYGVDYAVSASSDLAIEFDELRYAIETAGLTISSLMVCPIVDKQSTPPGSDWPDCPPLKDVFSAARKAFPDIPLGGGMLTYFTELNRKRPPLDLLDFVAHGTNPIVHAADDISVMQTLSSLAYITSSARRIRGDRKYHLGLSSISMRQNPYGSKTVDNVDMKRVCMANVDPRQFAQFGAAYTTGYAANIAQAGLDYWTPSAFIGPCGIVSKDHSLSPMGEVVSHLVKLAGKLVSKTENSHPSKVAALCVGSHKMLVNLTPDPINITVNDGPVVELGSYAVRFDC